MEVFKSLLQPLSSSAVGSGVLDATKLVILGGTVETARKPFRFSTILRAFLAPLISTASALTQVS
jgi:hypothetical protein